MIKILVDGHVFDGKPQGSCSYIAGLYGEISKNSMFDIYIACQYEESFVKYMGADSKAKWIPLKSTNKYARLAHGFDGLCDKIKPDYSHFTYITPLRKKSKWINTIHDILFLDFPGLFPFSYRLKNHVLFRASALRSDLVLTISQYSKERLSSNFKLAKGNILVTPIGISDFSDVVPEKINKLQNEKYFLYVSRFEPRKNQHSLINAFNQCQFEGAKLVLVGSSFVEYPELQALLSLNKENIVLFENISRGELKWLYANSIASFYPSKGEGFGIPPLEAIAASGISYSSDNTALSELTSYLHDTFDPDSLTEMIALMQKSISSDFVRTDLSSKANENFSWKNSAEILTNRLLSGD